MAWFDLRMAPYDGSQGAFAAIRILGGGFLKVQKRQVRVLYAPYGQTIVLFRIHKKGSPQEQTRAYDLAKKRKQDHEFSKQLTEQATHDGHRTIH